MIRVRMGLDRPHDLDAPPVGLVEVLFDRVRRIHDHGDSGVLVTDEVGGAAEVVVDELREDHGARDGSTLCRYFS
jgi:hypothetical protein